MIPQEAQTAPNYSDGKPAPMCCAPREYHGRVQKQPAKEIN